jgi:hypothetical protein
VHTQLRQFRSRPRQSHTSARSWQCLRRSQPDRIGEAKKHPPTIKPGMKPISIARESTHLALLSQRVSEENRSTNSHSGRAK